jgi:hypothetical protein
MVKHLALLQSNTPQLLISSSSSDTQAGYISIQTLHGFKNEIDPTRQKQGLLQSAGIDSAESFFDTLALPVTTKDQAARRAVLGTEESVDYYKTSKGALTAYRNISEQARLQSIIILLDGTDTVNEITGSITNRDYEYILSGLTPSE